MYKKIFNIITKTATFFFVYVSFQSCIKDLDVKPLNPNTLVSTNVYTSVENYKSVLAKVYAGLATTGQRGPAGDADIKDIDEGFSQYLRQYWQLQQLPTDEAIIAWVDAGLQDLHAMTWSSNNPFVQALYYRIFFQIGIANEFIRESNDSKLNTRGFSNEEKTKIKTMRAEARLLRAMSYWHALDLYSSIPFITENSPVGSFQPEQISPKDLFNYIESELKDIEPLLIDARQNEFARADKASAWMILAKLYLNAKVYINEEKFTECITYCKKIIDAGYSLGNTYTHLFLADNKTTSNDEVIFFISFDAKNTQSWGGMTYLTHAPVGGEMVASEFGINGGWGGLRTTRQFVEKFSDITGKTDQRALFFTKGQTLDINDVGTFKEGYAIAKYKNITSTGEIGKGDPNQDHVNTDFPMFRLADVFLMYAEAVLRNGNGGDKATALNYINKIRQRAYGNTNGNITNNKLTLDFILDERARELYWEGHRRMDLRRFNKFTSSNYIWQWKGNVKSGKGVDNYREIYPLPATDIIANPKLKQNTGY